MDQILTLWVLECAEGKTCRLFTFYARDEQDAEEQATSILVKFPHLLREKLHPQPEGFKYVYTEQPGHIQKANYTV